MFYALRSADSVLGLVTLKYSSSNRKKKGGRVSLHRVTALLDAWKIEILKKENINLAWEKMQKLHKGVSMDENSASLPSTPPVDIRSIFLLHVFAHY